MTYSQELRNAVFPRSTDEAFIILLKFDHPSLDEPLYITQDPFETLSSGAKGVISNSIEYVAIPMEILLESEEETSPPKVSITIDNINRELVAAIRSINSAPDVTIYVVLSSNPDVIERTIEGFQLTQVTIDQFTIRGDLTTVRFDSEPFPKGRFTPNDFTGLQ